MSGSDLPLNYFNPVVCGFAEEGSDIFFYSLEAVPPREGEFITFEQERQQIYRVRYMHRMYDKSVELEGEEPEVVQRISVRVTVEKLEDYERRVRDEYEIKAPKREGW